MTKKSRPGSDDAKPAPSRRKVRRRARRRAKPRATPAAAAELGPSGAPVDEKLDPNTGIDEDDGGDDAPTELGIGSRMVPPPSLVPDEDVENDDPLESPGAFGAREPEDVEAEIRALEARLDGMIRRASSTDEEPPASIREQVGFAAREVVERLAAPLERPGNEDGSVVEAARELLSSDYYLRQWGRLGMRSRSEEVDEFGLDPTYEARLRPFAEFLYKRYFRIETQGVENIPEDGRCIVVANHSGTLPLDGLMLNTAVRLEHPSGRELRWLAEDFIFYLPFVGAFMNRVGAVRACQENAERLLKRGSLVAVFPEGVKGIKKLYRERYRLQRFGRGGFIRLCLRTATPLVPTAIIGAEEASPMLYRVEYLSKALGLPYIPVTPTFPLLGPLGLLPAPSKWRIAFGEPLNFDGYGPEAADDHVLVGRLADRVRSSIQGLIDGGLRERKSVWFG
jgi:1-acyl-sn-glycerol-3-phosphate acyltransferase